MSIVDILYDRILGLRWLVTNVVWLTTFYLISLMMLSCDNYSLLYLEEDSARGITIPEAQSIFEKAIAESTSIVEVNPTSLFLPTLNLGCIVPNWSTAKKSQTSNDGFQRIDVEISSTYRYRAYQIVTSVNDTCVVNLLSKLVIVKDELTGNSGCFVEFFVRSNGCMKDNKKGKSVNYPNGEGQYDYSGLKIYTDMAGNIVRVNKYENGLSKCGIILTKAENATDYLWRIFVIQRLLSRIQFQKGMLVTRGGDYGLGAETDGRYIYLEIGGKVYRISLEDLANGLVVIDGDTFYGGEIDASEIIEYLNQVQTMDPDPYPNDSNEWENWQKEEELLRNRGEENPPEGGGIPMNRKKIEFGGNFRYHGYGDAGNCFDVAVNILAQLGYKTTSAKDAFYIKTELMQDGVHMLRNMESSDKNGVVQNIRTTKDCVDYLIESVGSDRPVVIGVDYKHGTNINERTTDHFLVIWGYGYEGNNLYFHYIETGRGSDFWGAAHDDRKKLYYDGNAISGIRYGKNDKPSATYTVTQYRKTSKL